MSIRDAKHLSTILSILWQQQYKSSFFFLFIILLVWLWCPVDSSIVSFDFESSLNSDYRELTERSFINFASVASSTSSFFSPLASHPIELSVWTLLFYERLCFFWKAINCAWSGCADGFFYYRDSDAEEIEEWEDDWLLTLSMLRSKDWVPLEFEFSFIRFV